MALWILLPFSSVAWVLVLLHREQILDSDRDCGCGLAAKGLWVGSRSGARHLPRFRYLGVAEHRRFIRELVSVIFLERHIAKRNFFSSVCEIVGAT